MQAGDAMHQLRAGIGRARQAQMFDALLVRLGWGVRIAVIDKKPSSGLSAPLASPGFHV